MRLVFLLLFLAHPLSTKAQRQFKQATFSQSVKLSQTGLTRGVFGYSGNYFTHCSNPYTVHVFNENWDLEFEYSNQGKGPVEFMLITRVKVFNKQVFVLDNANAKIVIFDISGRFINEIPIKPNAFDFVVYRDQIAVNFLDSKFLVTTFDIQTGSSREYLPKPKEFQLDLFSSGYNLFFKNADSLFFVNSVNNHYLTVGLNEFTCDWKIYSLMEQEIESSVKSIQSYSQQAERRLNSNKMIYNHADDDVIVCEIITKVKGGDRILDYYDRKTFQYLYSIAIPKELRTLMFSSSIRKNSILFLDRDFELSKTQYKFND